MVGFGTCCRHATVAGSRTPSGFMDKGQKSDVSIVEVALYFRSELINSATSASGAGPADVEAILPVILLTNDNGQLQLAKAHGLPAVRIGGEVHHGSMHVGEASGSDGC